MTYNKHLWSCCILKQGKFPRSEVQLGQSTSGLAHNLDAVQWHRMSTIALFFQCHEQINMSSMYMFSLFLFLVYIGYIGGPNIKKLKVKEKEKHYGNLDLKQIVLTIENFIDYRYRLWTLKKKIPTKNVSQ